MDHHRKLIPIRAIDILVLNTLSWPLKTAVYRSLKSPLLTTVQPAFTKAKPERPKLKARWVKDRNHAQATIV